VLRFALLLSLTACGTDVDLGGSSPTSGDGAVVLQCGDLVAPQVDAGCRACTPSSSDCQPNGCYGGYWCDTPSTDCRTPPKTCP
jgi:hypothetical protein